MTNEIKRKIIALRKQGYGYKKIAKETGIALSSIRYVCAKANDKQGVCLYCGKTTISIPHKKAKKFCCDKCRWDYWNVIKSEERKQNGKEQIS